MCLPKTEPGRSSHGPLLVPTLKPRTSSHNPLLVPKLEHGTGYGGPLLEQKPKSEPPLLAEYRGAVASELGSPADLWGLLKVLCKSTKGPQCDPDDPVDSPRLRLAVVASVANVTIEIVSDDDEDFLGGGGDSEVYEAISSFV